MQPKWHIAFCNVTYTGYAGVSYADYYGSPAVMLETQLAAQDYVEQRFGVGRFIRPAVDSPSCTFASYLGMPVVEPNADELAYVDTRRPLVTDPADLSGIRIGDPRTEGLMARRWGTYQYYREQGYEVGFGGASTAVITLACQVSADAVLLWLAENPDGARALLERLMDAMEHVARFDAELRGAQFQGFSYTGDDNSGLLSPAMYREFAVPCYRRLYADNQARSMHSELLRAEHLRIAREELGITSFHGAGCVNLTLAKMREIMGPSFWTQLTPQEMAELTPEGIAGRIRELAGSGCSHVQLYPGRDTPEANLQAAIEACGRECPGGPAW